MKFCFSLTTVCFFILYLFAALLWHRLRMACVPDHPHPHPSLPCPHGRRPQYLETVLRVPPKGSTFANRILPPPSYSLLYLLIISLYSWFNFCFLILNVSSIKKKYDKKLLNTIKNFQVSWGWVKPSKASRQQDSYNRVFPFTLTIW